MNVSVMVFIFLMVSGAISFSQESDPQAVLPPKGKVPAALVRLGDGQYHSAFSFVVDKSDRTLTVWKQEGDRLTHVAAYPTDMGRNSGDKVNTGDHKTPEGIYFLQEMYQGPQLNFEEYGLRAFTMDYPNLFDRRKNKTGSGIWLHAIPETKSLQRGSRGCVVVRNKVIEELKSYVRLGQTPIVVLDKVDWVAMERLEADRKLAMDWVEQWRAAWAGKSLEKYLSFYHPAFTALGMDRSQWGSYKDSLNSRYKFINVNIRPPIVLRHRDEWVIRFLQDYSSDQKSDFGEKTLYAHLQGDPSGIIAEEWVTQKKTEASLARQLDY